MRFTFVELPTEGAAVPITRPAVPIVLEQMEQAPLLCLADSGALHNRFDSTLAEIAGVDLSGAPEQTIAVAGVRMASRAASVTLGLGASRFDTTVWFCSPWPFAFQLLGQEGFFRHFRVTICAREGWLDVEPEPDGAVYSL